MKRERKRSSTTTAKTKERRRERGHFCPSLTPRFSSSLSFFVVVGTVNVHHE
jgi:hypothetical protein